MLHKGQNSYNKIKLEEGQRSLLCSNKELYRCPSLGNESLTYETINSLTELGDVLKQIRERLFLEGYIISSD
ncbi:MAG: hypothetical protein NTU76_03565 [Candidatus Taylorbacteria bacterium]|nr:hypothetical protein [Candidatus Taylorbacteria bacterium]